MSNIRIIEDKSGDFKYLVQYKVDMTYLNKWFIHARCHTRASAEERYAALKMNRSL